MDRDEFIQKATEAAEKAKAAGAPISVPIAVAQAALESNWGRSQLAGEANNLKGVKAGSSWQGSTIELPTKEWRESDGTWYTTTAKWRKYVDWQAAFEDYGRLIERVYPVAASRSDGPRAFLEALINGDRYSYATDPLYVQKVWRIVEEYGLLDTAEPDAMLLIFDVNNNEVARLAVPKGGSILDRQRGNRRYIRIEAPQD